MKFAQYNPETGEIIGFFDDRVHTQIPAQTVEISEAEWNRHLSNVAPVRVDVSGAEPALVAVQVAPPTRAERLAARKPLVSAECRRRIYAVGSGEAQTNMNTVVAVISTKPIADRTTDDEAIVSGAALALGWVDQMRAAFRTLAADETTDFTQDAAWPPVPAEVVTLMDRF